MTKDPSTSKTDYDEGRLVIYLDDPEDDIDFVTLHNILYYLYTNSVNLRRGSDEYPHNKESHPPGYPDHPNPFDLYKSAKKYLLTSLSDYCYNYLKSTLSKHNVTKRLFRPDCELRDHEELKDLYMEYLQKNYDKIKTTEDWQAVVFDEEDVDASVREFHKELLFEIIKSLTYTPTIITSGYNTREKFC
jgi:hypothetical protein